MKQVHAELEIETKGQGLQEITQRIASWVSEQEIASGLLTLFIRHTSASLLIQENADPTVQSDLLAFFKRLVPEHTGNYRHALEGLDDMPAHIRGALTGVQLSIPVIDRRLCLGTWQGIYIFEHRASPHRRSLALHLIGETC